MIDAFFALLAFKERSTPGPALVYLHGGGWVFGSYCKIFVSNKFLIVNICMLKFESLSRNCLFFYFHNNLSFFLEVQGRYTAQVLRT